MIFQWFDGLTVCGLSVFKLERLFAMRSILHQKRHLKQMECSFDIDFSFAKIVIFLLTRQSVNLF